MNWHSLTFLIRMCVRTTIFTHTYYIILISPTSARGDYTVSENMSNKQLSPDDVDSILIDACKELIDDKNGVTSGKVLVRLISQNASNGFHIDVKKLREIYGYTQDQMAQCIRVTPSTIKGWEQGIRKPKGPSTIVLAAMARVAEKKRSLEKSEAAELV